MNTNNIALSFSLEQVCNDLLSNCNLISKNMVDEAVADIRADIQSPDSQETRSLICRAITEAWGKVKYQAQRYLTSGRAVDDNSLERIASYGDVPIFWSRIDSDFSKLVGFNDFSQSDILNVEHIKPTVRISGETDQDIVVAIADGISFDVYDHHGNALVLDAKSDKDTVNFYANAYSLDRTRYNVWRFSDCDAVSITFDDSAFPMQYEKLNLLLHIDNFNLGVTDALKSSIHKFLVDYVTARFLKDLAPEKAAEYVDSATADQESIRMCLNARARIYTRRASWL